MPRSKLSRLELQILGLSGRTGKHLFERFRSFFRNLVRLHDHSDDGVPARRQERVRRVGKISNAHIFELILARDATRHRLLDELLKNI